MRLVEVIREEPRPPAIKEVVITLDLLRARCLLDFIELAFQHGEEWVFGGGLQRVNCELAAQLEKALKEALR
jgi:hypothetical protein